MMREKLATRWSGGRTDFEETFLSIDPDWGPRWDFDAEDIEYIKAWFGLYIQWAQHCGLTSGFEIEHIPLTKSRNLKCT